MKYPCLAATSCRPARLKECIINEEIDSFVKKPLQTIVSLAIPLALVAAIGMRAYHQLHKPPVAPRTVLAQRGDLVIDVSETGVIEPQNKVDVKSKVAGRLLAIYVQEGQYVRQGQLIALVDRSLIDPQIASTRAQLEQAQARLVQSEAAYKLQVAQSSAAIAQAKASLAQAQTHYATVAAGARPQELAQQKEAVARAQIALADAKRTLDRKEQLLAQGFAPQSDVDSAQLAYDTDQSNLETAQEALSLTQAGPRDVDVRDAAAQVEAARVAVSTAEVNAFQNAVTKTNIDQNRAAVAQAQNDLAQLLVQLADTRIVAPASGIVLKKYKEVNEIVQSATTGFSDSESIVATLGSEPRVSVDINEVDISKVQLGDPVDVHVDALPDTTYQGVVREIAPASTNAFSDSGSSASGQSSISKFSVKIGFLHPDARLATGMTATVDIISSRHKNVVLVPLEAVGFTGNKGTVSVLGPNNKPVPRQVVLGPRNDTQAEVISGLEPGDKVVPAPINGSDRRTININGQNN